MSKRVFVSSLSGPAPSAAGADTEDDDDAAPDEDSSPDEDEQPLSNTSKGNGQAPAAKQRGSNRTRECQEFNRWSRSDNSDAEIKSFIRADLAELNELASPPFPRVTTIASAGISTGTGCIGTVGPRTRAA